MVKLGHADERLVIGYINACGSAVIRKKRDENGNLVRMTDDDLAKQYKLPSDTPTTPPKKDY